MVSVRLTATRSASSPSKEIVRLYERLEAVDPSPIVALNRAVAVALVEGPAAALADFARRLGDSAAAARSYRRALELAQNDSERRFLERRLREVE
jgi:RNA polymerase sigma-70 factor (ECF subfamily)